MNKSKIARLVGFAGALGISAALVTTAVSSTGAYFTSSQAGNLSGTSGHLTLNVTDPNLSFTNLVPGNYKTLNINYNVDTTDNADVWMVFADTASYCQFTGAKTDPACSGGGMGRFGHFAVANNNSTRFTTFNLQNTPSGVTDPSQSCGVDANGNGGSNAQAQSATDTPPYCGVPLAIKLASNLSNGTAGEVETTFGITGFAKGQGANVTSVPFQLVATQVGVRPDAGNF